MRVRKGTVIGKRCRFGEGVIIDDGCEIGDNVSIWHHTVIRSGVHIGNNSVIGHNAVIERDTFIGNNVTIQSQCHITAKAIIEDDVFFAALVCLVNEKRIASHGRKIQQMLEGPKICRGARIGAMVLIMPGVTIGENAYVAGGAIVAKDIPDNMLYVPNLPGYKLCQVPEEELI